MKIRIAIILAAFFILLPIHVQASQPIRIEFYSSTWEDVRLIYGIRGPSTAVPMVQSGNVWSYNIAYDSPFFIGGLPTFITIICTGDRSRRQSYVIEGSSRIQDGEVTPLVPDSSNVHSVDLSGVYERLDNLYDLFAGASEALQALIHWIIALLSMSFAVLLILVVSTSIR